VANPRMRNSEHKTKPVSLGFQGVRRVAAESKGVSGRALTACVTHVPGFGPPRRTGIWFNRLN